MTAYIYAGILLVIVAIGFYLRRIFKKVDFQKGVEHEAKETQDAIEKLAPALYGDGTVNEFRVQDGDAWKNLTTGTDISGRMDPGADVTREGSKVPNTAG